jgi:hypothetical protein
MSPLPRILLPFLLLATLAPTTIPDPIAVLINQLGSDRFQTRETAFKELLDLGLRAKPALQKAVQSPDPQIATSAYSLLNKIDERCPHQIR